MNWGTLRKFSPLKKGAGGDLILLRHPLMRLVTDRHYKVFGLFFVFHFLTRGSGQLLKHLSRQKEGFDCSNPHQLAFPAGILTTELVNLLRASLQCVLYLLEFQLQAILQLLWQGAVGIGAVMTS